MTQPGFDGASPRYYITTAIPYVNARPHIGHAMEFVLTDALARYHRLKGEEVWFLTGTDENSLKNVQAAEREGISTQTLVERNAAQFYLLREIKATEDGDFTLERFSRVYNADLADQLGNLLSRLVGMVNRYYTGIVPAPGSLEEADRSLVASAEALRERVETAMSQFAPHAALAAIWEVIGLANKYVAESQPWRLARQRQADPAAETRLATILYNLAETLRLVVHCCVPFLPVTAATVAHQLGLSLDTSDDWTEALKWGGYPAGTAVRPGGILFPKLEIPAS